MLGAARAAGARGLDVVARTNRQGRGAHQAHEGGHDAQADGDDHVLDADAQHGHQRQRQQKARERQQHVDDALDDQVEPAAVETRDGAQRHADRPARRRPPQSRSAARSARRTPGGPGCRGRDGRCPAGAPAWARAASDRGGFPRVVGRGQRRQQRHAEETAVSTARPATAPRLRQKRAHIRRAGSRRCAFGDGLIAAECRRQRATRDGRHA